MIPTEEDRLIGPLVELSDGYVAIRFQSADGPHYGWIRVRLQSSAGLMRSPPEVLEWAYETRAGRAIIAGAKPVVILIELVESTRDGFLRISWKSEVGKAYQVQSQGTLNDRLWINLNFLVVGTSTNATIEVPLVGATAFYRVVEAD